MMEVSNRLTICYLFSEDVYLSLAFSPPSSIFSSSFVTTSEIFCGKDFKTFVILSAILLPIKSPVASAVFWIVLSEAVFCVPAADCLTWSISFLLYLPV